MAGRMMSKYVCLTRDAVDRVSPPFGTLSFRPWPSPAMILMPGVPLLKIILISQIMNGVLLPFVLLFMLRLVNDKALMGSFTNGPVYNAITWATTIALVGLTALMVVTSFLPAGAP